MAGAKDALATYRAKRDFTLTPEPAGVAAPKSKTGAPLVFVVQKHWATRLHYDFRLELDGVMVSWAVPKGPSFDPADKRMAVHVEDHPVSYNSFEGTIPPKQYGAGTVIVWDNGTWEPVGDPRKGLADGKLQFELHGHKLHGVWELIRMKKPGEERQDPWLLFKKKDSHARPRSEYDVTIALPDSVLAKPPPAAAAATRAAPPPAAVAATRAAPPPAAARKSALPETFKPQLAQLATAAPISGDWIYEIKFDGYRLLARCDRGKPTLVTRNGHDWTDKMPTLALELEALELAGSWLDGEIVVIGDNGAPSFNALQKAFDKRQPQPIVYYLFDAPFLSGEDLRETPLAARRERLRALLAAHPSPHLRFSDDFPGTAETVLESACRMGLEGVIAKRSDAPYRSERTDTWLKLKCRLRQEFVVAGWTDRANAHGEVGSLILGVHDDTGKLVSVGSVGTGWDQAAARSLHALLAPLERDKPPFDAAPAKGRWSRRAAGSERWAEPKVVVEVGFGEWTPDGQIRHSVWVGVRDDKPATAVTRERAAAPAVKKTAAKSAAAGKAGKAGKDVKDVKDVKGGKAGKAGEAGHAETTSTAAPPRHGVKVTHPERVIDASTGATKLDLVRYYESVADWILPHLVGRPVSLVRGPGGISGQLFFQKHGEKIGIPGIRELDAALWPGHDALLEIDTVEALVGAAQMNVIELHTWNSTTRRIDAPDRVIFDLDPGEGVTWKQVQEATQLVHALLDELGLQAWLKTSGGKGLHIVVPLAPKLDYDTVKGFSQAVVQHLARTIPDRFSAKSGAANRVGRIFVDYLRNGLGATTATAFSARARPGMGVSMPVTWDELGDLTSGAQWTIATARDRLSFQHEDPWAGYAKCRQTLTKAMQRIGFAG